MNDLIKWIKVPENEKRHFHLRTFQCLNENLHQLNNVFDFLETSNISHKIKDLNSNFEHSYKEERDDNGNSLFMINENMEKIIRDQTEIEISDQRNDKKQETFLILSLVWMVLVSSYKIKFSCEVKA
jgi:hypothetical protein